MALTHLTSKVLTATGGCASFRVWYPTPAGALAPALKNDRKLRRETGPPMHVAQPYGLKEVALSKPIA